MGSALYLILSIYEAVLIVRILMSWVNPDPFHPIVKAIHAITDPVLEPVRKLLPAGPGGMDFSPIVVFILIGVLKRVVTGIF